MQKIKYLIFALLCAVAQGAWAADYEVYNEDQLRAAIVNGATIELRSSITLQNCIEIGSGVSVTIHMNGQTLSRSLTSASGSGNIFYVNGGTLILSSSSSDHGTLSGGWDNYGGAIEVTAGGTLEASDITFSGNKAAHDGGAICNKGTATLNGCSFTGNSADDKGGAIYNEGTIKLPNVTISECSAQYGGGIWNGGSNAALDGYYGRLSVTDCTATVAGGGIYSSSSLNLAGNPIINGNTVNSQANNLYLDGSNITIDASAIYDNSTHVGVTLSKYNRVFTSGYNSNNSTPDKYFYPDNSYASVKSESGQAYMELLSVATDSELNDAVEAGKPTITLVGDITLTSQVIIASGQTVTIDLNGHKLSRNLSANENYGMVIQNYGNLTIDDGSGNNSGSIEGGRSYNGGGILCESGSTLTVNGGTFKNNDVERHAGDHGRGGAIFMNPNTTLTVNGGKFESNSAYNGGAIYIDDGGPDNLTPASATINGITFTNCSVTGDGGAIYNQGSLTINGITVSSNSASGNGGGIYSNTSFSMKGKCVVNSNTVGGNANNVYLYGSDTKINVAGAFSSGTKIGVCVSNNNRLITSGYSTYHTDYPGSYFSCDNEANFVSFYSNEALLTEDLNYAVNHYSVTAKLTKDITLSSALVVDNNVTVTLNLNGKTLDRASTSRDDGSQVIYVKSGATLNIRNISNANSNITGGWGGDGGGILNEGTLSIDNVIVRENTADDRGGGISNKGTLTMTNSFVYYNTCKDNNNPAGGGGLFNYEGATATLTYCSFGYNKTEKYSGGGICNYGTLTLNNCSMKSNKAYDKGGGIYNRPEGTLIISDGITVTDNIATNGYGDGIYSSTSFSMKGKCVVSDNSDSNVYLNGSDTKITVAGAFGEGTNIGVGVSNNNRVISSGFSTYHTAYPGNYFSCDNGANFVSLYGNEALLTNNLNEALYNFNGVKAVLTEDLTISSAITVASNMTATLDLNGYTLDRGATERSSQVIGVSSGATLHLTGGTVKGGWGGDGGGILNEGTLNISEVTITGCTADDRGGAVSNNGSLTMTDCTLTGNTSNDKNDPAGGGGLFNYSGKTATLTNCTITGNTATTYGGGGICNKGTMTLTDCEVTDNSASQYHGGGIWNNGTLAIDGITVTGNTASGHDDVPGYGDGIYSSTSFSLKGKCVVTGNSDSNVYLNGASTNITFTGALAEGSSIGLGVSDYDRALTSGYSDFNSADPADFFSMDNGKYGIAKVNGEAYPGIVYYDHEWVGGDTDGHVVTTSKVCSSFSYYDKNTVLNDGWYVLSGTEAYSDRAVVKGDVKFILMDGSDTEFEEGIHIQNNKTLTIYGQSAGTGMLRATGDDGFDNNGDAAIGGNNNAMGGSLVIHGGIVTAKPDNNCAAGIGGGQGDESGMQDVTIYGGNINAEGRSDAAGIGGGEANCGPTVTIYGGTVIAKGGSYGAGIGGGQDRSNSAITIYSGTVNAEGGSKAAGIGGGEDGTGGGVTIYGGTVIAKGGKDGAGIGGGHKRGGGSVAIYGGTVNAEGNDGSYAIGSGDDFANSNSVTLTLGSTVCVKSNGTTLVACSQRTSTINSATKVAVEACSHSGEHGYTNKDLYYHTVTCDYCEGYDEAHTLGSNNDCEKCHRSLPTHTITFYESNADGTDYATTGTDYTAAELTDFTMPECTTVPGNLVFAGWEQATEAPASLTVTSTDGLLQAGDKIQLPMGSTDRAYYARYTEYQFAGSGTEDDPYLVRSTDEWNRFASAVNSGNDFSGKYLKLTRDITVTTMVGGQTGPGFSGTFDGDGWSITVNYTGITEDRTAPFRYLIGATIKDLEVDGTIETSARYAGGIAAYVRGKTKIENCYSYVTISSSHAGFSGHGGIVALKANYTGAKPTIEGCLFGGKILTTGDDASTFCGGIVGYTNGQTLNIKNCLVMPETLGSGETRADGSTLYNNSTDGQPSTTVTISNCYYTEVMGTAQGMQAYTVTSGNPDLKLNYGDATTTYQHGFEAYDFGLLYDDDFFSGEGQSVSFISGVNNLREVQHLYANGTELTGTSGLYTLTMPAEHVTITADLSDDFTVTLYDNPTDAANTSGKTNKQKIRDNNDWYTDVTLKGRTLYKDGSWNTLCLPFDVEKDDMDDESHPLHGAEILWIDLYGYYDGNTRYDDYAEGRKQTGFDAKTGTLYLYFEPTDEIESGYAYLVRWGTPGSAPGGTITDPTFTHVWLYGNPEQDDESADGKVSFVGNFDPVTIGETDDAKHNLYLGSGNMLYYPTASDFKVNAFRAYFHLNGITAGEPTSGSNGIRAFSLHFGNNSEQTGIATTNYTNFTNSNNSWYTLDGRKLNVKPTAKGIYIFKGNKRVIK